MVTFLSSLEQELFIDDLAMIAGLVDKEVAELKSWLDIASVALRVDVF